MTDLDNQAAIKELDKSNVYGSVEALPDQCADAWAEASQVKIPSSYRAVDNLVMTGMGGSGLGARLIESVFADQLKVPLVRVNDYDLPGFVNPNTLVVCSSYSGSTEETIENARQAIAKKAKWLAIGTGGQLIEMAKKAKAPYYKIDPRYNPSNQPRMAIGYSVIGQLVLASKAGVIKLPHDEVDRVIKTMKQVQEKLKADIPQKDNPAKKMARKLKDKLLVFIAARHLTGAVHTVKNQFNENAKTFATRFDLPELNHHLMEGLKHPASNQDSLAVFMVDSDLYPPRIKQRLQLTGEVIAKNGIKSHIWRPASQSKLSQVFELIQFGAYVNFYLSMLYNLDPAPIPWVDYFKKKLK